VIDSQGAIQALVHLDAGVCITAAVGVYPDLQALLGKAHHIVRSDSAPVLEAEEQLRLTVLCQRTIGTAWLGRSHCKLRVKAWQILRHHLLCLL
jgi:hypothetical protein